MSDRDSGRLPWTAGGRDRRPSNDTRRTPLSDESSDEEDDKRSRRSSRHSSRSRNSDRRRQSEISVVMERSRKQSRQSALSEIRQEAIGTYLTLERFRTSKKQGGNGQLGIHLA